MAVHYLESIDREMTIELFKMIGNQSEEFMVELFISLCKFPKDCCIMLLHFHLPNEIYIAELPP